MKYATNSLNVIGAMAELVDASVLGTDFLGSEGSSPFRPTLTKTSVHDGQLKNCDHQQNVDKSVYSIVYDTSISSTFAIMESVVYKEKQLGRGLRKNHTFHLNNTCANYSLSTRCFLNITSTTLMWWSCRRFTISTRRRTPVSLSYKEMFSQCPQKHISPHYNNN